MHGTPAVEPAVLAKAELHLHIEGTLEPAMAFRLAARHGIALPYADVAALTRAYSFSDLSSFLALYYACMAGLRTEQDFYELADAYLRRASADGVRHAEVFFDPQAHTSRGVPLEAVIAGLTRAAADARARDGVTMLLIACFLRDRPPAEAMQTLDALAPYANQLVGVGLDSAEVGHPPSKFVEVFEAAAQLGLRKVAHAGEEGPPDYIWQALDLLGVERVDHGIRCMEDPALVRRLAADAVPITVCPLSNVRLRCVGTLADHPLRRMLDAGLLVTVNSDDPAYFGGYVGENYRAVHEAFGLSAQDMSGLAANSFAGSFLAASPSHPFGRSSST